MMNASAFFKQTLSRAEGTLHRALDGLTTEELRNQPAGADSNPIGWLMWHLARVQDYWLSNVQGVPTEWESSGWADRFGGDPDPRSFKPETVHTFDAPDVATLQAYYAAVRKRTDAYVDTLSPEDFDRELPPMAPGRPAMTVGAVLSLILDDNTQHMGQVAYLRGLLRGHGWY